MYKILNEIQFKKLLIKINQEDFVIQLLAKT